MIRATLLPLLQSGRLPQYAHEYPALLFDPDRVFEPTINRIIVNNFDDESTQGNHQIVLLQRLLTLLSACPHTLPLALTILQYAHMAQADFKDSASLESPGDIDFAWSDDTAPPFDLIVAVWLQLPRCQSRIDDIDIDDIDMSVYADQQALIMCTEERLWTYLIQSVQTSLPLSTPQHLRCFTFSRVCTF